MTLPPSVGLAQASHHQDFVAQLYENPHEPHAIDFCLWRVAGTHAVGLHAGETAFVLRRNSTVARQETRFARTAGKATRRGWPDPLPRRGELGAILCGKSALLWRRDAYLLRLARLVSSAEPGLGFWSTPELRRR